MTHNSQLRAASYLAGELSPIEREDFDNHLLACEGCWAEVEEGRRGLLAATQARELAPVHLRERIREALAGSDAVPRRRRGRVQLMAAAAAIVVAAGALAGIVAFRDRPSQPAAVMAAVEGYAQDRLPGASVPTAPAPDLSSMDLTEVGAGRGRLGDHSVDAYAFRDAAGRRLMVYVGSAPFPMPTGGRPLHGPKGPWMASHDGIAILCARYPHELLIVAKDDHLVHGVAEALDVM